MRRSSNRKLAIKRKKLDDDLHISPQEKTHQMLENLSKEDAEAALKRWRAGQKLMPTPVETLKVITRALLDADPTNLVQEILDHICAHKAVLCNARTVTAVLDVLARSGQVALIEELIALVKKRQGLEVPLSSQTYEALLGGHAAAGDKLRVKALLAEARAANLRISPRAFALTIKGFLNYNMLDAGLEQMLEMQNAGFSIPPFAVTHLLRCACEAGRTVDVYEQITPKIQVPSDAFVLLTKDALKRDDLKFALSVEKRFRESEAALPYGAYDGLLKLCVAHSDMHALQLFEDMQKRGHRIAEGLCVGLLARCADSKFLQFAEVIVSFLRGRDGLSLEAYSSLMKCYAYSGMYDKACDLYDEIRAAGLQPDSMMYGCLMKFSVECGRTALSRELFDKAPSLDIQNYMSLIRAAGRDKDVARAFSLLHKLEASGTRIDIAAYSCVLDACVSAGDMEQAHTLVEKMKKTFGTLDIVTFNILLKGYCSLGEINRAKELLTEMTSSGFPPNDVSFNCLINAVASKGDIREAWQIVDMMENSGVSVDHYTISIVMKSLKRVKSMKYVNQAFALLDRVGIKVCSDQVLMCTVLEVCIRHNQADRLESILQEFSTSAMQPCVHTYGLLIKACSVLKRVDRCWQFWKVMVEDRRMVPNDIVLGRMLDALVCNNRVDDAVNLLRTWKEIVPPNTVMYSTVIKGFANSNQAGPAMAMWKEMQDLQLPMNNMVYHALIDAQARIGAMDQVFELLEDMASKGCEVDAICYSTIVKGYCVKGDIDKAFEVFRGMQAKDKMGGCIVFNTMLDGCTKHNRMDLADAVIDDMEKCGMKPSNFTLGILVKMYGRRRDLDKAFEVVDQQAQKHGIQPNLQVKTCLMCACLYNHDIQRALRVFEDLKSTGQGADSRAYSALISGIARNGRGRLPEAVKLVKEAHGLNCELGECDAMRAAPGVEAQALTQLLDALGTQGMMQSVGLPLLHQLRAAGVPISGRLFSTCLGSTM